MNCNKKIIKKKTKMQWLLLLFRAGVSIITITIIIIINFTGMTSQSGACQEVISFFFFLFFFSSALCVRWALSFVIFTLFLFKQGQELLFPVLFIFCFAFKRLLTIIHMRYIRWIIHMRYFRSSQRCRCIFESTKFLS